MSDYPNAVISTSHGDVTVELWNDVAPKHVENFLKLARDGFYDNLSFHRILPEFMIQGGLRQVRKFRNQRLPTSRVICKSPGATA